MKRLIASALAILFCLTLCVVIIYADPGDVPPQPPDSSYVIPPVDVIATTSTDSCDTCQQSPEPPWTPPDQ